METYHSLSKVEDLEKTAPWKRVLQQEPAGSLSFSAISGIELARFFEQVVSEVSEALGAGLCKVLKFLWEGDRLALRAGSGWYEELARAATAVSGLESRARHRGGHRGGHAPIPREPGAVGAAQRR